MDPLNKKVRSQAIRRFVVYYAVSVLLIALVIFFFVSPDYFFEVKNRISSINLLNDQKNQLVVQQVDSLNNYLDKMKQLDQQHFKGTIDSLAFSKNVNALEDSCALMINSINSNYNYSDDVTGRLTDKIITSYTTFLDIHKQLIQHQGGNIIYAKQVADTKNSEPSEQVTQLLSDIKKRDETVSLLQSQLHNLQSASGGTNNSKDVIQQLQQENQNLRNNIAADEKQKTQMQNNYSQMQTENANLKESLNTLMQKQSQANNNSSAADSREIASLQNKVEQLTAQVSLANIDCNIKRADVNNNVSSARQRKELLTQALQSLNVLIKSDNANIQHEARARINELNSVAKSIRE